MNDFTNRLRTHNLKATPQRLVILESIFLHGHINIEKLYEEVKEKFNSISLATIYKNINAMTKNMILSEVKLPNEKTVYEIVKQSHAHLLCNNCGKVIDVEIDTTSIMEEIAKQHDFQVAQNDIVISGFCKECR